MLLSRTDIITVTEICQKVLSKTIYSLKYTDIHEMSTSVWPLCFCDIHFWKSYSMITHAREIHNLFQQEIENRKRDDEPGKMANHYRCVNQKSEGQKMLFSE